MIKTPPPPHLLYCPLVLFLHFRLGFDTTKNATEYKHDVAVEHLLNILKATSFKCT